MPEINLANSSGRDAIVKTGSVSMRRQVRWIDPGGRQATSVRFVKSTIDHELPALLKQFGDASEVGKAMIDGDPEIDFENTGRYLTETSRVYVDPQGNIVHNVRFWEVIKNADGTERDRRLRVIADTNISGETPLRWSGIFIPKEQAIRRFVFSGKQQLHHVNGLTYDFLFGMAKDLQDRKAMMLLGAGPKSNQPLILRRGGVPYRAFLEGRVDGDRYYLVMHFSNLELKVPKPTTETEAKSDGDKNHE
jgi:hypothetical protein